MSLEDIASLTSNVFEVLYSSFGREPRALVHWLNNLQVEISHRVEEMFQFNPRYLSFGQLYLLIQNINYNGVYLIAMQVLIILQVLIV